MKDKLVSVIIPVYNVKKYLSKCISSVINQTYSNLEIILVDDGSTDGSGIMCDSFAQLDNRVKVIHKSNTGLGLSRNSGLKIANGDYVCFIDSDDYIKETMINHLAYNLKQSNSDAVIGGYTRVSETGDKLYSKKYTFNVYSGDSVKKELLPKLIGSSPYKRDSIKMAVWNVLFSMKIIKQHDMRFVSEREYVSEDIIWDIDYYNYAKKVVVTSNDDYFYRKRANSLTTKQFNYEKRLQDIEKLYRFEKYKLLKIGLFNICKERLAKEYFINLLACFNQIVLNNNLIQSNKCFKKIMNDKFLINIAKSYPYKQTNFKLRLFLSLIIRRKTLIMSILLKTNMK
ncbi:glycosyltransferase [Limosilactobacillus pontis]|uniref:glycosyltransferase n=1 Tax=Limosilactobacillus pontis TaxID=35787 RepID=UPI002F26C397